ncbi:hypothetical protein E2C01_063492 [Portunus trituberculatus]|uniref:Uncharacterized protein n=1 Tax=Portunus trituberculatus TaxID=210409 RepID=A0A5B7HL05_PORTR|nr:hypothetical protein [Portunus trituberculatus]
MPLLSFPVFAAGWKVAELSLLLGSENTKRHLVRINQTQQSMPQECPRSTTTGWDMGVGQLGVGQLGVGQNSSICFLFNSMTDTTPAST